MCCLRNENELRSWNDDDIAKCALFLINNCIRSSAQPYSLVHIIARTFPWFVLVVQVLLGSAVLTTPSMSFWSSVLIRLCDSASFSSLVGDAERFLLLPVDVMVTSAAISLRLFFCSSVTNSGLNCTITAVILSQPVPSPAVLGAKQAVNSCELKPMFKSKSIN